MKNQNKNKTIKDYAYLFTHLFKTSNQYKLALTSNIKSIPNNNSIPIHQTQTLLSFKPTYSQSQSKQNLNPDQIITITLPSNIEDQFFKNHDSTNEPQISKSIQTQFQQQSQQIHAFQKQGTAGQDLIDQLLKSSKHLFQLRQFEKITEILYRFKHKYIHLDQCALYKWNLAMGSCKRQQKQYQQTVKCFQQCAQIYENFQLCFSASKHANLLNSLGLIYLELRQWNYAASSFSSALQIYYKQKQLKQFSKVLNNLGSLYLQVGMFQQAVQTLSQVYRNKVKLFGKQSTFTFSTLYNLSEGHRLLNNYDQSQKILKYMRIIANQQQKFHHLSQINRRLAVVQHLRGRQMQALTYYEISRQILEQNQCKQEIEYGYILHDMARLNIDLGNEQNAKTMFQEASRLYNIYLGKQSQRKIILQRNMNLLRC